MHVNSLHNIIYILTLLKYIYSILSFILFICDIDEIKIL